ncbi:hypothetical protein [Streptomyces sp. YIM 121038]|uniref:hypothetical protein n=1 Tax=Streptomyces sp. YIM 121038 TaxID=2136401 RepID=UPI001110ABBB|nr:hypothetical protein [Streptomyces sp. YIM 121038]
MAEYDVITLKGEHGTYQTRVGALDIMIARYLPASSNGLQDLIRKRQGNPAYHVSTVSEALMILAELDGFATN